MVPILFVRREAVNETSVLADQETKEKGCRDKWGDEEREKRLGGAKHRRGPVAMKSWEI